MTDTPEEPGRYDLLLLTQAYNRGDITLEEWMRRTRAWAEAILRRRPPEPEPPEEPKAPD